MTVDQIKTALASHTASMWDTVLTSRGFKIGAAAAKAAGEGAADLWDDVFARRGYAIGTGA